MAKPQMTAEKRLSEHAKSCKQEQERLRTKFYKHQALKAQEQEDGPRAQ